MSGMEKGDRQLRVDSGPTPLPKAVGRDSRNQTLAVKSSRDYYTSVSPAQDFLHDRSIVPFALAGGDAALHQIDVSPPERQFLPV